MLIRNSSITMYEQIVALIKEDIYKKRIPSNGCLGTLKELAERYNVSVITVRKAIQLLEEQGIVEVKQGKGTFVSKNILAIKHNFFSSYIDVLVDEPEARMHILNMKVIDTPKHLPQNAIKALGPSCYIIERYHDLKGQTRGYFISYIPLKYSLDINEEEMHYKTIYEMFTDKYSISFGKGIQRIKAVSSNEHLSKLFKSLENIPLVHIERESYSDTDEFLEHLEVYCEYSQYEYTISLDLPN